MYYDQTSLKKKSRKLATWSIPPNLKTIVYFVENANLRKKKLCAKLPQRGASCLGYRGRLAQCIPYGIYGQNVKKLQTYIKQI